MGELLRQAQISTLSLTTFNAEQLRETVRGSDFVHAQLSGGPFHGRLLRSTFGDSVLDAGIYSQDLLVNGSFPGDRITLGYIVSGSKAGYFNGLRLAEHDIIIITEGGAMAPYRLPAGTQWVAFQTLRDLLERDGITVPAPSRVVHYSGLSREALQLGRFIRTLVTAPHMRRMESTPHTQENGLLLEDELIAGFRRAIDASQGNKPRAHHPHHRARARILREFEDVVEHNLSIEVRMPELCAHLGTSQRTLENLCKDYYGMPPLRYLTVRRLNAVRQHLLHAEAEGTSIAAIAGHFGFRHAGRFAQVYQHQFREFPSHTLQARDAYNQLSSVHGVRVLEPQIPDRNCRHAGA